MNNPTLWLDIVVGALAVPGAVAGVWAVCDDPGQRRGWLKLTSMVCLGLAFVLGSADTLLTRRRAPRESVTGVVRSVMERSGKREYSTIDLEDDKGKHTFLRVDYATALLRVDERLTVEWMKYNGRVVSVRVLGGLRAGETAENVTPLYALLGMVVGAYLAVVGYTAWRKNPNADPRGEGGAVVMEIEAKPIGTQG